MLLFPDVLKVELRVEVNDQPLVIHAQVQGEGESAHRAAAELSAALTNTLAVLAKSASLLDEATSASSLQPALTSAAWSSSTVAASATEAVQPASIGEKSSTGRLSAQPPLDPVVAIPQPEAIEQPSLAALMRRYRARINLGFGGLLVALALLVAIITPADQQNP